MMMLHPDMLPEPALALQAIHERIQQGTAEALHAAGMAAHPLSPSAPLPGVCTALSIVQALEEAVPGSMPRHFLPHAVRLLGKIARENSQNAGLFLAAKTPGPALRGASYRHGFLRPSSLHISQLPYTAAWPAHLGSADASPSKVANETDTVWTSW